MTTKTLIQSFVVIALLSVLSPLRALGAQTVVMRELFDSIGMVSSSSPGQFTSVTGGPYYSRAVGPYVSPDVSPGWSADDEGQNIIGTMSISTGTGMAAQANGVAGAWVWFKSWPATGISIPLDLRTLTGGGHTSVQFTVSTSSNPSASNPTSGLSAIVYQGTTSVGPTLSLDTWYYMAVSWVTTGSNTFTFNIYCVTSTANFTPFATQTGVNQLSKLQQVNFGSNSNTLWEGRLGAPGVYSIATSSDVEYPPDLNPPVTGQHVWEIDPVNGNDNNTGLLGSPWLTAAKFDTESQYSGLMDTAAGYANGDILEIKTDVQPFALGNASITAQTRGLTVEGVPTLSCNVGPGNPFTPSYATVGSTTVASVWGPTTFTIPANCAIIQAQSSVAQGGSAWTLSGTYPNVYSTPANTDGLGAASASVVWEDRRWLNHVTSATASLTAAATSPASCVTASYNVGNCLSNLPGSFWTNGTTMYVHTFESGNPNSDGHLYEMSYDRPYDGSVVQMEAFDEYTTGIYTGLLGTIDYTGTNSGAGYCVLATSGFGGTGRIDHSYCFYGSKHDIGSTDSAQSSTLTVDSTDAEQCSPYLGSTAYVFYSGGAAVTGNVRTLSNSQSLEAEGLVGSTSGALYQAFVSHNASGTNQFSTINITNDQFGSGSIAGSGADITLNIQSTTFGSFGGGGNTSNIDYSTINTGPIFLMSAPNAVVNLVNNIIKPTSAVNSGWDAGNGVEGTGVVEYNTFDLSGIPNAVPSFSPLFNRIGPLNWTFEKNAVIWPSSTYLGQPFTILGGVASTDTVTWDYNAYQFGPGGNYLVYNYNNGGTNETLSAWQGLGYDTHSISPSSLGVNAGYRPLAGSPLLNAGINLGPLTDYLDTTVFNPRNTIGAFQQASGGWNALMFSIP